MDSNDASALLSELIGQVVVLDFRSTYVCLGKLVGFDREFLVLHDADLHDLRDSTATREVYVHDSLRLGVRRNRSRTLIRRDEVIAITRFAEIAES
jgi:small nuclear ribonucleoprotein (snRNP)-like protein